MIRMSPGDRNGGYEMLQIVDCALFALAVVLLMPVAVLALEVTAGCASRNRLFPQRVGDAVRRQSAKQAGRGVSAIMFVGRPERWQSD